MYTHVNKNCAKTGYDTLMRTLRIFFAATALAFGATDPSLTRLERQVEFVSHATDGVVGVSATHVESGRSVSVYGAETFPMASAFKVPVAVQLMAMIDDHKLAIDKMITLTPQDIRPESGQIKELLFHPGVSLSIENLMELMLVISDNTAADVLLREAGGPASVTAKMRQLGLSGIRVDRPLAVLFSDWFGAKNVPPEDQWTLEMWEKLYGAIPPKEHMRARRAQMNDPRDTATPDDMTKLLVHIWKKDLFTSQNARELLAMMERCQTGKARIKGLLPLGTDVAHKTGTLGGVVNDVGVVTLPGNLGHIAISVFTKASTGPQDAAEKVVAEIARTIYDYFVLVPVSGTGG
jgi:beta-lactamase class A